MIDIVRGTDVQAVSNEDAPKDVDLVILSVPFAKNPDVAELLANAPGDAIAVDTSNYYPARDGNIAGVDAGKPEAVWVSEQVKRPLIKAWNAVLSETLAEAGVPSGAAHRMAIPIAGDDAAAKKVLRTWSTFLGSTWWTRVPSRNLGASNPARLPIAQS